MQLRGFALMLACLVFCRSQPAGEGEGGQQRLSRFIRRELHIDPGGRPLCAYQLELTYDDAKLTVCGVAGGTGPVYAAAPHHDPRGLSSGRLVLAAFTLDDAAAPRSRTCVVQLHLLSIDQGVRSLRVRLVAAADSEGTKFPAPVHVVDPDAAEGQDEGG